MNISPVFSRFATDQRAALCRAAVILLIGSVPLESVQAVCEMPCPDAVREAEHPESLTRRLAGDGWGFLRSLPHVASSVLAGQLFSRIEKLRGDAKRLRSEVAAARFGAADAVISVVMPGGLIYAAIKQRRYLAKKNQLERVQEQTRDLEADYQVFAGHAALDRIPEPTGRVSPG